MGNLVTSAVFPRPRVSSYKEDDFKGIDRLLWINSYVYNKPKKVRVPCIFLPYLDERDYSSPYILMYFHANAEDLGLSYDLAYDIRSTLRVNVLMMEYASYGQYTSISKPSANQILHDSLMIYDYVEKVLKFSQSKIILLGRSMGTGPTSHLTRVRCPRASILFMPFKSIRNIVESYVKSKFLTNSMVDDLFNNKQCIQRMEAKTPILIIHGRADDIIPHSHSQELFEELKKKNYPSNMKNNLVLIERMTHNEFKFQNDLIEPITEFFIDNDILPFGSTRGSKVYFEEMPLMNVIYKDLVQNKEQLQQHDTSSISFMQKKDTMDLEGDIQQFIEEQNLDEIKDIQQIKKQRQVKQQPLEEQKINIPDIFQGQKTVRQQYTACMSKITEQIEEDMVISKNDAEQSKFAENHFGSEFTMNEDEKKHTTMDAELDQQFGINVSCEASMRQSETLGSKGQMVNIEKREKYSSSEVINQN